MLGVLAHLDVAERLVAAAKAAEDMTQELLTRDTTDATLEKSEVNLQRDP